jgi:lipopolysaccharide export system permease protein
MKKIIFRKLLSDCLFFFLITLLGISAIIWVFQAVNFLDIMIEDGRNYSVYLNYTLLGFPKIISRILPFAFFFSFSYIFIKYEMSNELVIFWNHGIEKLNMVHFFLKFSIIIMIFQIILLSVIVPKSQEIARSQLRSSNVDYFEGLIKPKKFNDTIKGLTVFADEKDINNVFKNIYIKKKTSNDKFQITFAKRGIFEFKGNKRILVLYDGQTLNSNKDKITNFKFSKSDYGMVDMNSHLITHKKIKEQSTRSLINCLSNAYSNIQNRLLNCNLSNLRDVYKELFQRLISPLYLPLLILISLLLILNSKEKAKYTKYKISIYLIGITTIVLSESSLGYIQNNIFTNIFLVILPLLLIIIFYSFILYKLKFRISPI